MSKSSMPWRYARAIDTLETGGVIAYPTEAVWGLGCDPFNESAVWRLLAMKQRPVDKGLILVAGELQQLGPLLSILDALSLATLQSQSQHPTTWLVPHHNTIPHWVCGKHDTVAVRISSHPVIAALCRGFGGLIVSTSANRAGCEPAKTGLQARRYFSSQVDHYVAGKLGGSNSPSQIRDLISGDTLRNAVN